jgi:phosphatidylserine/phosphatidylglycerophosphate/cardiolipin synthase-like enzyme
MNYASSNAKHHHHFLRALSLILCCAAGLGGCATPIFKHEPPPSPLTGEALLIDDDVYNQALHLIHSANHTLYIEQMALDDPVILNEIITKAQAGVEIRILLDRWQPENGPTITLLKNNNISAQYYPTEKGQYHRQKLIIADNETALFLSTPWTDSPSLFSSLALIVTGDTVQKALDMFARDWQYTTTLGLNSARTADKPSTEPERVTLTSTVGMKNLILSYIESACQTIDLETQQLSGDEDIISALAAAQKRGCKVRIILDSSCLETTPNTLKTLADVHIEYRYFNTPGKILSRNFAVFDTHSLVYTSSAWTYNTFVINYEGALAVPSPAAAQKGADIFQLDWESSFQ